MDSYATRSHASVAHQTPKVRTTTAHRAQATQLREVGQWEGFAVLVLAIEAALIWLVDEAVLEPGAHIFVEAIHSRGILLWPLIWAVQPCASAGESLEKRRDRLLLECGGATRVVGPRSAYIYICMYVYIYIYTYEYILLDWRKS